MTCIKIKSSLVTATVAALLLFELQIVQGIDYVGGWLPRSSSRQCVEICVNSKAAPTCPTSDPACLAKKQRTGNFDYLNVNAYPDGVSCKSGVVESELTIHGLRPNYNNGYADCCNVSDAIGNRPFSAASFTKNQQSLLEEMASKWVDPTQSNAYDTLCKIYNHEFQKHGLCCAASGANYEAAAVTYFRATLSAAKTVQKTTRQINKWASSKKAQIPTLKALECLFSSKVQVFCSSVDGTKNHLSAIRTCFEKPAWIGRSGPFKQVDCAPAAAQGALILCDPKSPISLGRYTPPRSLAYQQSAP